VYQCTVYFIVYQCTVYFIVYQCTVYFIVYQCIALYTSWTRRDIDITSVHYACHDITTVMHWRNVVISWNLWRIYFMIHFYLAKIRTPVQWDPRTKWFFNCLAGVQGMSVSMHECVHVFDACSDLDAGVWIYWIAHGNLHSRLLLVVYLGEVCLVSRAVIGHVSSSGKWSRFGWSTVTPPVRQQPSPEWQLMYPLMDQDALILTKWALFDPEIWHGERGNALLGQVVQIVNMISYIFRLPMVQRKIVRWHSWVSKMTPSTRRCQRSGIHSLMSR
jgi:hypothetical protein